MVGARKVSLDLSLQKYRPPLVVPSDEAKGQRMSLHNLLALSGSLRAGSVNTKLVHEAGRVFDPARFVVGDLNVPLFDADVQASTGIPAAV